MSTTDALQYNIALRGEMLACAISNVFTSKVDQKHLVLSYLPLRSATALVNPVVRVPSALVLTVIMVAFRGLYVYKWR